MEIMMWAKLAKPEGTDMARGVIAKLNGRPRAEQVAMMTEY